MLFVGLNIVMAMAVVCLAQDPPECTAQGYTVLSEAYRNVSIDVLTPVGPNGLPCDDDLPTGWYRFLPPAGVALPTSCPPQRRCGVNAAFWMNGAHPRIEDGVVTRSLCGSFENGCCHYDGITLPVVYKIQVRACPGGFFVYKHTQGRSVLACSSGYCATDFNECTGGIHNCDGNASCTDTQGSWECACNSGYFGSGTRGNCEEAGCRDPQGSCQHGGTCDQQTGHCYCPEGTTGKACETLTVPLECIPAGYTVLSEVFRNSSSVTPVVPDSMLPCDVNLPTGWYRFLPPAGIALPTSCPRQGRCGVNAGFWMNGVHPRIEDGVVTRALCGSFQNDCCHYDGTANAALYQIEVRACPGDFFVYKHTQTRSISVCSSGYCATDLNECTGELHNCDINANCTDTDASWECTCKPGFWGDGTTGNCQEPGCRDPQGSLTCQNGGICDQQTGQCRCLQGFAGTTCETYSDPLECTEQGYTTLSEAYRNVSINVLTPIGTDISALPCDDDLPTGWYRFLPPAGVALPTSCPSQRLCGVNAGFWMNGVHPRIEDGVVMRALCASFGSDCCHFDGTAVVGYYKIQVRACPGGFFVYKHTQARSVVACSSGYCATDFNECTGGIHNCDSNATCTDTQESWECTCKPGFWGNGTKGFCEVAGCRDPLGSLMCQNGGTCDQQTGQCHCPEGTVGTACETRIVPIECTTPGYTVLSEAFRNTSYITPSVPDSALPCDNNLPTGWYRFLPPAGVALPTSCPPQGRCGVSTGFWMNGVHPHIEDGVVTRSLCGSSQDGCCGPAIPTLYMIEVRACPGGFFVYKHTQGRSIIACSTGYCATDFNECTGGLHNCDGNATCTDTLDSWECTCNSGYWGNGARGHCEEAGCRDPQGLMTCRNGGTCDQQTGQCHCPEGTIGTACETRTVPLECTTPGYTVLTEAFRNSSYITPSVPESTLPCDNDLPTGWYRFLPPAGLALPTSCVPARRCGVTIGFWMNGVHPRIEDGVVMRSLCGSSPNGCCEFDGAALLTLYRIQVRACPGGFFVYYHTQGRSVVACSSGYCATGFNECMAEMHNCDTNANCTDTQESWECVCKPGFVGNGTTGNCFHEAGDCRNPQGSLTCQNGGSCDQQTGQCRCPEGITGMACETLLVPKECIEQGYTVLSEAWRNTSFMTPVGVANSLLPCDKDLSTGWYRFLPPAGVALPTICPPARRCGVNAAFWMNGVHPRVEDGVVTRALCGSFDNGCCHYDGTAIQPFYKIEVRACPGGFFVYKHTEATSVVACSSGYCATDFNECTGGLHNCDANATCIDTQDSWGCACNPGFWGSGTRGNCEVAGCRDPQGSMTCQNGGTCDQQTGQCHCPEGIIGATCETLTAPFECTAAGYTILSEAYRNTSNITPSLPVSMLPCDNDLPTGWYRFLPPAGEALPTSCPPARRCGVNAGFWLNGVHPRIEDGVVTRSLCGSFDNGCCHYDGTAAGPVYKIEVRACPGGFFVYKHTQGLSVPACSSGYCAVAFDECMGGVHNCDGNATCSDTQDSWECSCNIGYMGNGTAGNCEEAGCRDPRSSLTCRNGGTCNQQTGRCICPPGTCGVSCETRFIPLECTEPGYTVLSDAFRDTSYITPSLPDSMLSCDNNLPTGWYRFLPPAGVALPISCPPQGRCGVNAGFWMNGLHPRIEDGVVMRSLCGSFENNCCHYNGTTNPVVYNIEVRACPGDFFVYKHTQGLSVVTCSSGYCVTDLDECTEGLHNCDGNATCSNTQDSFECICNPGLMGNGTRGNCQDAGCRDPRGSLTCRNGGTCDNQTGQCICLAGTCGLTCETLLIPLECIPPGYTVLSEAFRNTSYITPTLPEAMLPCDKDLPTGWYRLLPPAGVVLPTSCPPKRRCGFNAGFWMNGVHPRIEDGVVTRSLCGSYENGCCHYDGVNISTFYKIEVRACPGGFFVYKHTHGSSVVACSSGYCATGFDECTEGLHNCDGNATCVDTQDSWECTCNPGFLGSGTRGNCQDAGCMDPRGPLACQNGGTCSNQTGQCVCPEFTAGPTCGTRLVPLECTEQGYTVLSEAYRNMSYVTPDLSVPMLPCDNDLPTGWYRFLPPAGVALTTSCPSQGRCGVNAGFWMNGAHPSIEDGVVTRALCGSFENGCCHYGGPANPTLYNIEVRACPGGFFVYKHTQGQSVVACSSGYCVTDYDECSAGMHNCDGNATCVDTILAWQCYCNPGYHGNGTRGNCEVAGCRDPRGLMTCRNGGTCDSQTGQCACPPGTCGPTCETSFSICSSDEVEAFRSLEVPIECTEEGYTVLSEAWRNTSFVTPSSPGATLRCDSSLPTGWYRFLPPAGVALPTSCIPQRRCGADAAFWMNGEHPSITEGIVTRSVCGSFEDGCCHYGSTASPSVYNIEVRACPGGFFVYKHTQGASVAACSSAYCATGVDECSHCIHNCDVNATCIDTSNSFECICTPGFIGNGTRGNCQVAGCRDQRSTRICRNGGTCDHQTGQCLCPPGTHGPTCETRYSVCHPNEVPTFNISTSVEIPNFIGCYRDNAMFADLPVRRMVGCISRKACQLSCRINGFPFAALQSGRQCLCGCSFGNIDPATYPIEECNATCTGSGDVLCGGTMRNAVYSTGFHSFPIVG